MLVVVCLCIVCASTYYVTGVVASMSVERPLQGDKCCCLEQQTINAYVITRLKQQAHT
jgi:hypothetical protein